MRGRNPTRWREMPPNYSRVAGGVGMFISLLAWPHVGNETLAAIVSAVVILATFWATSLLWRLQSRRHAGVAERRVEPRPLPPTLDRYASLCWRWDEVRRAHRLLAAVLLLGLIWALRYVPDGIVIVYAMFVYLGVSTLGASLYRRRRPSL